jgi:hypothetical protein
MHRVRVDNIMYNLKCKFTSLVSVRPCPIFLVRIPSYTRTPPSVLHAGQYRDRWKRIAVRKKFERTRSNECVNYLSVNILNLKFRTRALVNMSNK